MKRERRTLLLAIVASLVLHFAVGISIASFGDKLQPVLPEAEKPSELTLVNLAPSPEPPPARPVNAPVIDTPKERESNETPKEKLFQSNANSLAGSKQAASGELPVPTQEGRDQPDLDLEKQAHVAGNLDDKPTPTPSPSATPKPTPSATPTPTPTPTATPTPTPTATPEPSATPNPELLAMLRATPPPTIRAPEVVETPPPEQPPSPNERPAPSLAPSYRREERQTRMSGNISNRGIASVSAVATPLGRYSKRMQDAIGSRWYMYVEKQRDLVSIGTLRLHFTVDRSGRVKNLKIDGNSSNEAFANVCLQSVQEAKMDAIPEDLANTLPSEGLEEELTFTIYGN